MSFLCRISSITYSLLYEARSMLLVTKASNIHSFTPEQSILTCWILLANEGSDIKSSKNIGLWFTSLKVSQLSVSPQVNKLVSEVVLPEQKKNTNENVNDESPPQQNYEPWSPSPPAPSPLRLEIMCHTYMPVRMGKPLNLQ